MISSLKGKIERIWGNYVEVDVNGVGYQVQLSANSYAMPAGRQELRVGEEIKLYIHMAVSENDISLYGFRTIDELDLFKMLITVSGVGPKSAAGITCQKNAMEVKKAIGDADVAYFEKIKGIGKKTAQRIIVDLKSKIGGLGELNLKQEETPEDDLFLSLKQLGFDKKEIDKVMGKVPKEMVEIEEKLGWCLKNMN